MNTMGHLSLWLLCVGLLVPLVGLARAADAVPHEPDAGASEQPDSFRVLVFSKTTGFRHTSIPNGIAAVQRLGAAHGFGVDATEDAAAFTPDNLARYGAVIFLNTTQTVLDDDQKAAFQAYIRGGGGFVGVHAASDTEYDWPWYGRLVGTYFKSHPAIQDATVHVVDRTHASTRHLPEAWARQDEWYDFRAQPHDQVRILARLDEETYEGGQMGEDHPIAWYHVFDGGRAWYTGMGHTEASYEEPLFLEHLLGGIRWAAGREES